MNNRLKNKTRNKYNHYTSSDKYGIISFNNYSKNSHKNSNAKSMTFDDK